MAYTIYFKQGGKKYRLPVNPEEIKRSRSLEDEERTVLGGGQVTTPTCCNLEEFSFEAEFPSQEYHYVNSGGQFRNADDFENMFRRAQKALIPIRFIASNDITDDISCRVLVKSVEVVEKAGEEGDKYISLALKEYNPPTKRYVAVQVGEQAVKQEETAQPENPAVTEGKTYVVKERDTLFAIAKIFYGNGSLHPKIVAANPIIKNPNLIYSGWILSIPV